MRALWILLIAGCSGGTTIGDAALLDALLDAPLVEDAAIDAPDDGPGDAALDAAGCASRSAACGGPAR